MQTSSNTLHLEWRASAILELSAYFRTWFYQAFLIQDWNTFS